MNTYLLVQVEAQRQRTTARQSSVWWWKVAATLSGRSSTVWQISLQYRWLSVMAVDARPT